MEKAMESERLRLENERKELEKQVAVMAAQKDERDRISADMHDELGSGVTAIRLMSEIVKSKMKETSLPEIDKISNSANDLLGKMDTIIWTMKSSNDTVESLIAYVRAYAKEYFDNTNITCTVKVLPLPAVQISGEKRRNIFLGIKEALHNIVKHAQATEVTITATAMEHILTIEISDNGVGLHPDKLRKFGNGLNNMKRRMESIDGSWDIISEKGTMVVFSLPL
jgi:signal transduction histidine kinase